MPVSEPELPAVLESAPAEVRKYGMCLCLFFTSFFLKENHIATTLPHHQSQLTE